LKGTGVKMNLRKYRKVVVFILDLLIIIFVESTLFYILPESNGTGGHSLRVLGSNLTLYILCWMVAQYYFKTYDSLWRYAQSKEFLMLFLGGFSAFLLFCLFDFILIKERLAFLFTLAIYAISSMVMLIMRMSYRCLREKDVNLLWNSVRDIKIDELLGREPVSLNNVEIEHFLLDKVVMVTGGGGSIGSELCRQIAKVSIRKLVIVEIYENNAYDIQQELRQIYGEQLEVKVEIASVRDKGKVHQLMERHRPNIIFHAAAHKHVPLMEDCPEEAIMNNIFGTYNMVQAANQYGVDKFVLISTDKAVNPTNIMGASKRFCEMILQSMKGISKTEFVAVRFGNVLGSNGSVIPLFQRQID